MKFKIGDTIKAVNYDGVSKFDERLFVLGKEYVVRGRGLMKDTVLIAEEHHCCCPSEIHFELVKAKELSETEKEFYKVYARYEKLYLKCYPDRIHPYEQNHAHPQKYIEPTNNTKEQDVEMLYTKCQELKALLKPKNVDVHIKSVDTKYKQPKTHKDVEPDQVLFTVCNASSDPDSAATERGKPKSTPR